MEPALAARLERVFEGRALHFGEIEGMDFGGHGMSHTANHLQDSHVTTPVSFSRML